MACDTTTLDRNSNNYSISISADQNDCPDNNTKKQYLILYKLLVSQQNNKFIIKVDTYSHSRYWQL